MDKKGLIEAATDKELPFVVCTYDYGSNNERTHMLEFFQTLGILSARYMQMFRLTIATEGDRELLQMLPERSYIFGEPFGLGLVDLQSGRTDGLHVNEGFVDTHVHVTVLPGQPFIMLSVPPEHQDTHSMQNTVNVWRRDQPGYSSTSASDSCQIFIGDKFELIETRPADHAGEVSGVQYQLVLI